MRFQRKVCALLTKLSWVFFMYLFPHCVSSSPPTGSDGAASSYHVKQLEEQNARLKEALVRSV